MGGGGEDGRASQAAIPLIAGAIVLAQVTMVRLWHRVPACDEEDQFCDFTPCYVGPFSGHCNMGG
jgi:hypothetical protein